MFRLSTAVMCAAWAVMSGLPNTVHADPCGMVPPVYVGNDTPIARIGDQNTYVFFKDGVETFVIHPGFQGKVDEFGMLIPFPAIPELRKVPDNIFPHVRAAIDPPEVVVYAQNLRFRRLGPKRVGGRPGSRCRRTNDAEKRCPRREGRSGWHVRGRRPRSRQRRRPQTLDGRSRLQVPRRHGQSLQRLRRHRLVFRRGEDESRPEERRRSQARHAEGFTEDARRLHL